MFNTSATVFMFREPLNIALMFIAVCIVSLLERRFRLHYLVG